MSAPTRRTVLATAAWSAPVVLVASAAPAFATSSPTPVGCPVVAAWRTNHGHQHVQPGQHAYHLILTDGVTAAAVYVDHAAALHDETTNTWTTRLLRGGVHQVVQVLGVDGLLWQGVVRFQPTKPTEVQR